VTGLAGCRVVMFGSLTVPLSQALLMQNPPPPQPGSRRTLESSVSLGSGSPDAPSYARVLRCRPPRDGANLLGLPSSLPPFTVFTSSSPSSLPITLPVGGSEPSPSLLCGSEPPPPLLRSGVHRFVLLILLLPIALLVSVVDLSHLLLFSTLVFID
jgi:hypothetical protein